jgi:hypothetical protein
MSSLTLTGEQLRELDSRAIGELDISGLDTGTVPGTVSSTFPLTRQPVTITS